MKLWSGAKKLIRLQVISNLVSVCHFPKLQVSCSPGGRGGGVLPEKLGGSVRQAS